MRKESIHNDKGTLAWNNNVSPISTIWQCFCSTTYFVQFSWIRYLLFNERSFKVIKKLMRVEFSTNITLEHFYSLIKLILYSLLKLNETIEETKFLLQRIKLGEMWVIINEIGLVLKNHNVFFARGSSQILLERLKGNSQLFPIW